MSVTNILILFSLRISLGMPLFRYISDSLCVYLHKCGHWNMISRHRNDIKSSSSQKENESNCDKLNVMNRTWCEANLFSSVKVFVFRINFWIEFNTHCHQMKDIIHLTIFHFQSEPYGFRISFIITQTHIRSATAKNPSFWNTEAELNLALKLLTSVYDVRFISFVAFTTTIILPSV